MLIIAHLSLMIVAALCLIAGIGMAMFGRKKKNWLKWHKNFNLTGFALILAGMVMVVANVVFSGGEHLEGPHPWNGLAAFLLTGLTVFLGFYSFKAANKTAMRTAHRWAGRIAGIAILSALTLGLMLIGIL